MRARSSNWMRRKGSRRSLCALQRRAADPQGDFSYASPFENRRHCLRVIGQLKDAGDAWLQVSGTHPVNKPEHHRLDLGRPALTGIV